MKNKSEIIRIIKLTCIFLFVSIGIAFATESYAESTVNGVIQKRIAVSVRLRISTMDQSSVQVL
jgi:hypothetical protein